VHLAGDGPAQRALDALERADAVFRGWRSGLGGKRADLIVDLGVARLENTDEGWMRIAVCIKQVPDTEARLRVARDGRWIDEEDLPS
jgi:hypothetical protein